jgi:predicted AAA+ superfamily ATPase
VLSSVVKQSGGKFIYSKAAETSQYNIKQAVNMLIMFGLEILKISSPYTPENLYFWTREKEKSQAEIDFVIQRNDKIIPLEVKSGKSGKI